MGWFWSAAAHGFFHDAVNVPGCVNPVPPDAVPITDQEHEDLLAGQAGDAAQRIVRKITSGPDGRPRLETLPTPPLVHPGE
jgi:hypothetical protein